MICLQAAVSQEVNLQTISIPHLRTTGQVTQLYVNDKPFLALGGELGNSDASDLNVLESAFAKCQRMNLNTVMLPVYWDLIEPQEGKFDFSLVQGAIDGARSHGLHLVYLWFGTWKNSMSCYAPSWVKRDTARFARAKQSSGESMEIISPSSSEANDADARAFFELMRWTRNYDAKQQTVFMVQVENEIGMIPEPRDHSEKSEAAYRGPVPGQLLSMAQKGELGPEVGGLWERAGKRTSGTWGDVFGGRRRARKFFRRGSLPVMWRTLRQRGRKNIRCRCMRTRCSFDLGISRGNIPVRGRCRICWRFGAAEPRRWI